jgi:hypothetical protein
MAMPRESWMNNVEEWTGLGAVEARGSLGLKLGIHLDTWFMCLYEA